MPIKRMYTGPAGRKLIQAFEDCRLKAYKPLPTDHWTIGWGHCGPEVVEGLVWTQDHCDYVFVKDLEFRERVICERLLTREVNQNQFDALVSFAFNCGLDDDEDKLAEGLGDSTLLRHVNAGAFLLAAAEFPKWNRSGGKVVPGLVRRREAEKKLFLTPVPEERLQQCQGQRLDP